MGSLTEEERQYRREKQRERRAVGLCTNCASKARKGKSTCVSCAKRAIKREIERRKRRAKKANAR